MSKRTSLIFISLIAVVVFTNLLYYDQLLGRTIVNTEVSDTPVLPVSYLIYSDGFITYARNGTTGIIDYADSSASNVIQSAINAMIDGGKILLRNAVYNIDTTITIPSNIIFEGEGYGTILKATTDGLEKLVMVYKSSNVLLKNLHLDGDLKAYTLLKIITNHGVLSENIVCENLWLHSNKRGQPCSVLWAWDMNASYNLKNLYLKNIVGWDIDTGVSNHDNIAFSFVDTVTLEDSKFEIERVLNFFYTRHAVAKYVTVKANSYATFVVDSQSAHTVLDNCHSLGAQARLYGYDTLVQAGYYEDGLFYGDSSANWYGHNIVIDGAFLSGAGPLTLFCESAVIKNCRLVTIWDHVIALQSNSELRSKYVLLDGNVIDTGNHSIYGLIVNDVEYVNVVNNIFTGAGHGLFCANSTQTVDVVGNLFHVAGQRIYTMANWQGSLILERNKE